MSQDSSRLHASLPVPRCICYESPLRMVGEPGAMLSQSLEGVALGGFASGFGSLAFYGMKTLQKEHATGQSYGLLRPLVAVSGISKSMAGASWYLGWSERASVLFWKTRQTVALQGEVRLRSAAGFHALVYKVCPVILSNYLLCRLSLESRDLSFSGR